MIYFITIFIIMHNLFQFYNDDIFDNRVRVTCPEQNVVYTVTLTVSSADVSVLTTQMC